ncbi:restriction endonuclease [Enterococcus faecalis]|uniref:nSTAND3 domain-containing NTPase n=1 Tax=Enterococcus faecalis TaxID=1351 RepID=UPI003CC57184
MFDYTILNDHEFEILCRDIMQIELNRTLYVFPRGIDQGIDICDKKVHPDILIQAKHYARSSYSQLLSSLKKEIPKVNKHQPKQYFIMTTQSLTRQNKIEILNLFPEYMSDISSIWGKDDIDSFLKEEKNSEVVQQNFKLWLNASNVLSIIQNQNIFLDSTELLDDIESKIELFVHTSSYDEAVDKLKEHNILIVVGAPGVGKTTISEMIVLYYINQGYSVKYATNNNLSDLKKTISLKMDKKELILLDDFLGQHYLKLHEEQPNELKTLLSFISRSSSKKVILNSRITILNEAKELSLKFNELMSKYELQKYLIDLNKISKYEKAKILYNHLYFNDIPKEYFKVIKVSSNYLKIVSHENYNPRIIEYVTKKRNYELVSPENYYEYILDKLDKPTEIWRDEFENRMSPEDRCFMNTLYSLTDTDIEYDKFEQSFNRRIRTEKNIDTTTNLFSRILKRLNESLITIKIRNDKKFISVLNPSINDYLLKEISSNENEQLKMIDSAVFFEQIVRCNKSTESEKALKEKLFSNDILRFETLQNSIFYYFLEQVVKYKILNKQLIKKVQIAVERSYENLEESKYSKYSSQIISLLYNDMFEFYNLSEIFCLSDKLFHIIQIMSSESVIELYNEMKWMNQININEETIEVFRNALESAITKEISHGLMYEDHEIASDIMSDYDEEDLEFLETDVEQKLEEKIYKEIESSLSWFPEELKLENKDELASDILGWFNISDTISDLFKNTEEADSHFFDKYDSGEEMIKAMFEK